MPPKSLSSLLLPALDNMPVESPETEDPDAFFEGESFQVQEVEDVEDWEDFLTLRAIWVVSRGQRE